MTLIELMSVMVILGITLSMVGPRIDLHGYAVEAETRAVGSELMKAQRQAVQAQHDVVVAFDVEGGRLRVHADANVNGVIDGGEEVRQRPLGEHVTFGRGGLPAMFAGDGAVTFTRLQEGLPSVTFRRNGSVDQEGGFYLTSVRNAEGGHPDETRAVRILRATGRAEWFGYDGSNWVRTE
jgi:type II secretory pathway pseudopilin PulG